MTKPTVEDTRPGIPVTITIETLDLWHRIIHDETLAIGDRLQRVAARISQIKDNELQSIRSAELPVEPDVVTKQRLINERHGPACDFDEQAIPYIDALKAYALKEKERADCAERDDNQKAEANRELWKRAEKAESELATRNESLAEANRLLSLNVAEVERLKTELLACDLTKKGLATMVNSLESELAALRGRLITRQVGPELQIDESFKTIRCGNCKHIMNAEYAVALKEGK